MKYTEIQWIPFAPGGKKWWVFEHENAEDEIPVVDIESQNDDESVYRPTGRIIGQYLTIKEALTEYPDAIVSEKAMRAWESGQQ